MSLLTLSLLSWTCVDRTVMTVRPRGSVNLFARGVEVGSAGRLEDDLVAAAEGRHVVHALIGELRDEDAAQVVHGGALGCADATVLVVLDDD
jgi:hypothetical protein